MYLAWLRQADNLLRGPICHREAICLLLLFDILSCPYCTIFVVAGGSELAKNAHLWVKYSRARPQDLVQAFFQVSPGVHVVVVIVVVIIIVVVVVVVVVVDDVYVVYNVDHGGEGGGEEAQEAEYVERVGLAMVV